jgi:hypothetical protein
MELMWQDRRQSWQLNCDGGWSRVDPHSTEVGIQELLIARAKQRPMGWDLRSQ